MSRLILYPLIIWAILITTAACSADGEDILAVEPGSEYVREELKKKLNRRDIWFSEKRDSMLLVKKSDAKRVINFLNVIANEFMPYERSMSFNSEVKEQLLKRLDSRGIEYRTVNAHNTEWVVWSEEDNSKVKRIVQEISTNLSERGGSETDNYQ